MKSTPLYFQLFLAIIIFLTPMRVLAGIASARVPFGDPSTPGTSFNGPTENCVQNTGAWISHFDVVNEKYPCVMEGKKLMLVYMGWKFTAPEGMYTILKNNEKIYVGKGGTAFSFSRQ